MNMPNIKTEASAIFMNVLMILNYYFKYVKYILFVAGDEF